VSAGDVAEVLAAHTFPEPNFDVDMWNWICACGVPYLLDDAAEGKSRKVRADAHAAHVAAALAPLIEAEKRAAVEGALDDAAANMPLNRPGQPYEHAAGWLRRRAEAFHAASDALRGQRGPSSTEGDSGTSGGLTGDLGGDSA
jgi:hypothetical protein